MDENNNPVQSPPAAPQVPSEPAVQAPVSVPPVVQTQAPTFHPNAVGGAHKEFVPASTRTVEAPVSEYVRPAETAPVIPQEVGEAGVEATADIEQPKLDQSHQAAGIEPAPVHQPIPAQSTGVKLPYTLEEATAREKATGVDDQEHWLVALTKYIMRKLQAST